jgi:hypothetical protein
MNTKASPKPHIASLESNEQHRLNEAREKGIPWKKWGPYLSERQWGTVREDCSQDGNAWDYFSHDQSHRVPTAGEKTVWRVSPMTNNNCVSRSHCGTAGIRF